jgi:plastocyanin
MFSRFEIFGWVLAVIVIAIMGIITFTGPYHKVNKARSASASSLPALHVRIVTDPKTAGRYTPSTITAKVGQAVTFTNVSDATHTVSASNNSFNSGDIGTGNGNWTFVPSKPGRFQYYCVYHPLMHGVLVVKT